MCGRFVFGSETLEAVNEIATIPEYIQEELHFSDIYPSQKSLVLYNKNEELYGELLSFGFYSDHFKKRIINARAQGLDQKWMFRKALAHDRVLIPCTGFYEWSPAKVKTYFFSDTLPVLYMAGLAIDDGFVIITTDANASVADIHHRMPLILPEEEAKDWVLDRNAPLSLLRWAPLQLDRENSTLF